MKCILGSDCKDHEYFEIEISPYILIYMPTIIKIEVLNPEKVMRFTFSDETIIKTVCGKDDTFNFEFSFYLACAKYLYSNSITPQGIEVKAKELMYNKGINKIVKKGMKVFQEQEKQKEKEAKEKAEREAARKNKIAKKIAKKTKIKEARITEITEAIKKANDR